MGVWGGADESHSSGEVAFGVTHRLSGHVLRAMLMIRFEFLCYEYSALVPASISTHETLFVRAIVRAIAVLQFITSDIPRFRLKRLLLTSEE